MFGGCNYRVAERLGGFRQVRHHAFKFDECILLILAVQSLAIESHHHRLTIFSKMRNRLCFSRVLLIVGFCSTVGRASLAADTEPPKIFLDKSPRIVAYQLGRLDDEHLLMVPRSTDDPKYIPVYEAIVARPAMAAGIRDEAFEALAKLRERSVAAELVATIGRLKVDDAEAKRLQTVLAKKLIAQPANELAKEIEGLRELADGDARESSVAMAALLAAGKSDLVNELSSAGSESMIARLRAIELLPSDAMKRRQRSMVENELKSANEDVQAAAIDALSKLPGPTSETFAALLRFVDHTTLRTDACRGLLRLPKAVYDPATAETAARSLVTFAEKTDAADRTSVEFIDSMRAVDRLLSIVEPDTAKSLRRRLREVAVRVVKIGTVEEEMRYDVPYFAVEAGRPVQILLENHDLMPHNLVVTQPGALKSVAMAGLSAGPEGTNGLPYVPDSPNVVAASAMIAPDATTRITLTAPEQPGEYPYVCTFPQHWYRMYGVMVVVKDLDAWNQNPIEPANPLGSNRSFVQAWTMDDFAGAFDSDLAGRSTMIGEKIFNEASCVGCHKVNDQGGVVGPDLTDVYTRWKSDHQAVLREILEPSHKIDSKYAMQTVLTVEGKTYSGIVIDENDDILTLVSNPEDKEPIVISQEDIELTKRSATSMMPKALMDQYTKEEILELMAYLKEAAEKKAAGNE